MGTVRDLICISTEGHLHCERVASRLAETWTLRMVHSAEEALALPDRSNHGVAVIIFGRNESTWLSESDIDALDAARFSLVALLAAEVMHQGRVRELIATRFYDYHTLPVDPTRLLATLGHAHGMAKLRANLTSMPIARCRHDRDRLGRLVAYVQSLREAERSRIARDVHDELGQSLTAVKLKLSALVSDQSTAAPATKVELTPLIGVIDELIGTTQRITTELRPAILDCLGLEAACEWLVDRVRQRTGLDIECACEDLGIKVDTGRRTALFRILQEALTNVVRHAEATEARVSLVHRGRDLVLEVRDNGKGLSTGAESKCTTLGLLGIRERASMLGGEAVWESSPQVGTRLVVRIPLEESTESLKDGDEAQAAAPNKGLPEVENGSTVLST